MIDEPLTGRKFVLFVSFMVIAALIIPLQTAAQERANYFQSLKQKLIRDGFDQKTIEKLYAGPQVSFDEEGVSLFLMHREAVLNYDQFTSRTHIKRARKYMEAHQKELKSAQETYGVEKRVITAILLVETKLGTYLGKRNVLNTLSTMAAITDPKLLDRIWDRIPKNRRFPRKKFEKRAAGKAKWAYKELKALLSYAEREKIDPSNLKGSYAGAMGIAQFMPTSVLAYAKDGNKDGRVDLFTHADSIASIANYLKSYGWRDGLDDKKAYKVVYHYNHSKYYVAAVLKIADLLKGE